MKINKIFLGFAVATLAVGFSACQSDDDFLKEHSYTINGETLGKTQNEIEMSLNACYQGGSSTSNGGLQYVVYGTNGHNYLLFGWGLDQFSPNGNNSIANNPDQFGDVSNGYARHWYNMMFKLVNFANTTIDMIENNPDVSYSSNTKKNELLAEARFMRAWSYRVLTGMFGRVPILEHATTTVTSGYEPSERQQVWEFIKEDLTFAAENMPSTPRLTGCPTKATADHYLAEVDLALGDFDGAIAAANRVINKTDGDYEIMTHRFGVYADRATDRYGHPVNAYWDLFRADANGDNNQNYGVNGNKEALWTAQYGGKLENYADGGGGQSWWRVRGINAWESAWQPERLCRDNRSRKTVNGEQLYTWTWDGVCYPDSTLSDGTKYAWSNRLASQDGITDPVYKDRYVKVNTPTDSLGGGYAYVGGSIVLNEHTQWDIWGVCRGSDEYKNIKDFRGSETMLQRNWYTPGGKGIREIFKDITTDANGKRIPAGDETTLNHYGYLVTGSDTIWTLQPRVWKYSQDEHLNGNTQEYSAQVYLARVAETYLLRAEAYLAKGDKQSAANDINVLRDRVGAPRCTAADVDIDYILDERTRELLGEEQRVITLNRLSCNPNCGDYVTSKYPTQNATTSNTFYERVRKYGMSYNGETDAANATHGRTEITYVNGYGEEVAQGSPGAVKRIVPGIKPWMYQYPIPSAVIDSNTGAEYPQNEGY